MWAEICVSRTIMRTLHVSVTKRWCGTSHVKNSLAAFGGLRRLPGHAEKSWQVPVPSAKLKKVHLLSEKEPQISKHASRLVAMLFDSAARIEFSGPQRPLPTNSATPEASP